MTVLRPIVVHRGLRRNVDVGGFATTRGFEIAAYVGDSGAPESALDGIPVVTHAHWREHLHEIPSIVTALDPLERRAMAARIAADSGAFASLGRASARLRGP